MSDLVSGVSKLDLSGNWTLHFGGHFRGNVNRKEEAELKSKERLCNGTLLRVSNGRKMRLVRSRHEAVLATVRVC